MVEWLNAHLSQPKPTSSTTKTEQGHPSIRSYTICRFHHPLHKPRTHSLSLPFYAPKALSPTSPPHQPDRHTVSTQLYSGLCKLGSHFFLPPSVPHINSSVTPTNTNTNTIHMHNPSIHPPFTVSNTYTHTHTHTHTHIYKPDHYHNPTRPQHLAS
jgi:hypothetical protein